MTEPFAKLLASITDSSIWDEDNETRIVWVTLLAMANREGFIPAAVTGIAHRARVPIDATERALERFMAADKYSRNPDHDGRRMERAEGGWQLLNYAKIRNNLDAEAVREYERERKRKQREKPTDVPDTAGTPSASVSASGSDVTREDVAARYLGVTGKTDLPPCGLNWSGRKADAGDTMRRWANANGGLVALEAQLIGLAGDEFMQKQPVHVWADRVGTFAGSRMSADALRAERRALASKLEGAEALVKSGDSPELRDNYRKQLDAVNKKLKAC